MVFLFDENAGVKELHIKGESYKYLIKVRRHKEKEHIAFRNPAHPEDLYRYELVEIQNRSALFMLKEASHTPLNPPKNFHLGWCVIDSKSVEKVLASLNEIGVSRISFIYCDRSQKNFKVDIKRYERILEASNQQCGRTHRMEFEIYKTLQDFLCEYPDVKVFDFCEKTLACESNFETVLVGCEGGFSDAERELLQKQEVFRLDTPMVLRSESAALAVASKILL
jgi:16S rRNA (uracil1498-N3)-methyltransferase